MRFEGYDDEIPDEEAVIDEVLQDRPRARELRLLRAALEQRLAGMRTEQSRAADDRTRQEYDARITEIRKQIAVLRQEEAITGFVEGAVRATLNQPEMADFD